ncbi:MAG: nitroreductase family protein [Paracoccaceae bacterium]
MSKRSRAELLAESLKHRFDADAFAPIEIDEPTAQTLSAMAGRGSCRSFTDDAVSPEVIRTLCAIALASPTKSDLQQRDIIMLADPALKTRLAELVAGQDWIGSAPHIAVFCGNNRRQRQLHARSGIAFENDHLDAFFNAAVDAGIALSAFVTAAEALGLGCCPISGVRNRIGEVSELLQLPDHVFPVAGLAFGHRADAPRVSFRLPLEVTVHEDHFSEAALLAALEAYDARRRENGDYPRQRRAAEFGESDNYSWSEDKARQYNTPERSTFGAHIRAIGFSLD